SAPMDFAWSYWTDVANWKLDADVDAVEIDGAFRAGARGVTLTRSSGRVEWRVTDVQPGKAVIEFPAPGAVGAFVWTFIAHGDVTKITQRASLAGEQAAQYAGTVGAALSSG